MKTTYLIIGTEGQLGREFAETLIEADRTCIAPAEKDCSIIDRDRIARVVDDTQPDVIINCAAYNAVDAAEGDPETAFKINSLAVADLARICCEQHIRLVHFGSDYVFDGQKQALYVEADPPPSAERLRTKQTRRRVGRAVAIAGRTGVPAELGDRPG
jgi:dTDP-4-dehydrorhamnose reductase